MQKWYVVLGADLGSPLEHIKASLKGGPLSSLMFNVCVGTVIREWLQQVLGDDAGQEGIGETVVGNYAVAFFVGNGLVAARCPEWLQSSSSILINLLNA